jgi:hypothetical protein
MLRAWIILASDTDNGQAGVTGAVRICYAGAHMEVLTTAA